jgi:hypothetical protein
LADANCFSIIVGLNRLNTIKLEWNPDFAYAIGLLTTDGCLSKDGRHIDLTSKDLEQLKNFKKCLGLKNKIGRKISGYSGGVSRRIQFGDINYYNFLLSIGLTPAKTHTLGELAIPDKYFRDFFRGCIDGDGNISVFRHPESRYPQLRVRLASASVAFLIWIKKKISKNTGIKTGWIEHKKDNTRVHTLIFAKDDSIKLLKYIYNDSKRYLARKYKIAKRFI